MGYVSCSWGIEEFEAKKDGIVRGDKPKVKWLCKFQRINRALLLEPT